MPPRAVSEPAVAIHRTAVSVRPWADRGFQAKPFCYHAFRVVFRVLLNGTAMLRVFLAILGLVGLISQAQAATLESLSIERMSVESTAIVRGRPVAERVERQGPLLYTVYDFAVVERWKGAEPRRGAAADRVEVALPGGVLGDEGQRFSGVPKLDLRREYLLFLWTGPSGRTHVTGLSQGLFELRRAPGGELRAIRDSNPETVLVPGAPAAEAPASDLPLDRLLDRIEAALAAPGSVSP